RTTRRRRVAPLPLRIVGLRGPMSPTSRSMAAIARSKSRSPMFISSTPPCDSGERPPVRIDAPALLGAVAGRPVTQGGELGIARIRDEEVVQLEGVRVLVVGLFEAILVLHVHPVRGPHAAVDGHPSFVVPMHDREVRACGRAGPGLAVRDRLTS